MSEAIIVFNAGSTSVKFGAYEVVGKGTLTPINHGEVSDMQTDPQFVAKNSAGKPLDAHEFGKGRAINHRTALHASSLSARSASPTTPARIAASAFSRHASSASS